MPTFTTIQYGPSSSGDPVDNHVIVGLKPSLLAALESGATGGWNPRVLKRMVDNAKPSSDKHVTATTSAFAGDESKGAEDDLLVTSSIVLLPTACSRHNAAARPHAVTAGVQACATGSNVLVTLVVPTAAEVPASVVAVARAFPKYNAKTSSTTSRSVRVVCVVLNDADGVPAAEMERLSFIAEGARGAAALVDMPTNVLHSDAYIAYVKEQIAGLGLSDCVTLETIQGTDLRDRGFGGLWSVGQAAEHLPALAILTYTPAEANADVPVVAMAGKGIMYDTGGLSIKTKTGMPGMKRDMGGSAALLHAFLATAQAKHPQRLLCLLCIAENAVGKEATRPDDVIIQYSGRSVEINNTDAEGRLVLGDGVAYATKDLDGVDILIDMATLTGAQGVATGKHFGATYCNSESLEAAAVAAGKVSGDLVHPMPYAPEFFRAEFASVVADFKNSVANRSNAQVSCAGQFIGNHIAQDWLDSHAWLHVDMAAPAHNKERGTGFGVAMVAQLLAQLASSPSKHTP